MTELPPRARELATRCREACERWAAGDKSLDVYGPDLGGMCAVASYTLWQLLLSAGFRKAKFAFNPIHCWVELDGWVIDVTATQFDKRLPKVHVVRIGEPVRSNHPWDRSERITLSYDAQSYGEKAVYHADHWDTGQAPTYHAAGAKRIVNRIMVSYRRKHPRESRDNQAMATTS